MGPRPFRRGNHPRKALTRSSSTLQWGHALSGVETGRLPDGSLVVMDWLQWGHALSGVETALSPRITPRLVHSVSIVNYVSIRSTSWRVHSHPRRSHPGPDRLRKVRALHTCEPHHRTARNQAWATLGSCPRDYCKADARHRCSHSSSSAHVAVQPRLAAPGLIQL